jgi:glycosyltransferase involved in cell wall biosynthesis
MSDTALPLAAVVLPPREGFGHGRTGAIGLLARRLTATPGFRTLVIGGPQDGPTFPDVAFRAVAPSVWWPGSTNLRYARAVAGVLTRLRPAIVEVHNRPEIALALAARLPATPVTLILNNDPQTMRGAATPADRAALLARLALVLNASGWLRDRLLDGVPAPARDPAILPNCLDLRELPPPARRERLILFAGRVVQEKGPDAFVQACAAALPKMPGWAAVMIGADRFRADSPDTEFVRVTRAAAEAASVQVLGYRDHPSVLQAMARAAIVVVPSRWPEPFGLVALEALASGAALICSPRGGLPEVAGDAAVYADPDRPAEIAAALRLLGGDDAKRAALARAGQARAQQFDAAVIAGKLAALRRQAMAAKAGNAGGAPSGGG